jgi:hypothetical protein
MSVTMKKLREVETVIEHGEFLGSLCKFIYAQTIVDSNMPRP